MKKNILFITIYFSLLSLFAQSKNYTVDMYALSNYSRDYHVVEKLDFQTADGNEFRVVALQKNEISDSFPRSKLPILILKKQDGNKTNVIVAKMESIEVVPYTVSEGLQFIESYKNGFSIQQSFEFGRFLYIAHLYFEYEEKDRFRLVRYTEEHIDRYSSDKDFTEIEYEIDENTYFEDITSDWIYNTYREVAK